MTRKHSANAAKEQRPIIFVCHSLGGIVAREVSAHFVRSLDGLGYDFTNLYKAMIRLHASPTEYNGLLIDHCGLLFLGTPHSGSTLADWNNFVSTLSTLFAVRTNILDKLRSFNGFGVESKQAFGRIKPRPPYFCLCETNRTSIAGKRELVSYPSYFRSSSTQDSLSCC